MSTDPYFDVYAEDAAELRDELKEAIDAERERCAKIAETVDVPCNGHPQIDAPTISDARRVIAAAIRAHA